MLMFYSPKYSILLLVDRTLLFLYTFFAKGLCDIFVEQNIEILAREQNLSNLKYVKQILMLRFSVLYFF